jgi:predicted MFS family arabinose efflux permease
VFALIGLASAGCLYEAAFPVIVAVTDPRLRDRALLAVTIVAGFASSIFFPLTGALLAHYGWRTTLVLLAGLLAITAIPGHLCAVPARHVHHAHTAGRSGATVREAIGDIRFWLLGLGFVAQAAATSAVGMLLVSFLQHAGYQATLAASVSALLGVLSVTGRLVTTGLAHRHGMTAITAAVFAVQAAGALALPYATGTLAATAACITAFGLGFGVATIARPAILADRYGTSRYATVAATMSVPITLAKAGAPLASAALGGGRFLTGAGLACLLAAGCLWTARPRPTGRQADAR